MSFGLIYWILMLIWFVFGLLSAGPLGREYIGAYNGLVSIVLLFILFLLLGWRVFGPPVRNA
jgi:hypothetical protein